MAAEGLREVGDVAAWSVSTCKPGFGIQQLRDGSAETYWQSDGALPHAIEIRFPVRTPLALLRIFLDYKQDESYTPQKIIVRAGSHYSHVQELRSMALNEPVGWVDVSLGASLDAPVCVHLVQIVIVHNHQNGKDTHIRNVEIYAPRTENEMREEADLPFLSTEFQQYAIVR